MSNEKPLVIDLIRHGEPEGGVMYRGSKDDPLSAQGWQQMRNTINKALADQQSWEAVISSPMQRCRAFAEWLADTQSLPLTIVDDLREMHFGDLEGMRPDEAWQQHGELLKAIWKSPETIAPPNGETFTVFAERIAQALIQIENSPHERLLIVCHGGVIRAVLKLLMNMTGQDAFRVDIPYASMTRFTLHRRPGKTPTVGLAFINGYRSH